MNSVKSSDRPRGDGRFGTCDGGRSGTLGPLVAKYFRGASPPVLGRAVCFFTGIERVRDHNSKHKVGRGSVKEVSRGGMRVDVGDNPSGAREIWFATFPASA